MPSDVQPGVRSDIKPEPVSHPAVSSLEAEPAVQLPPSVLKPSVIEAPMPEVGRQRHATAQDSQPV